MKSELDGISEMPYDDDVYELKKNIERVCVTILDECPIKEVIDLFKPLVPDYLVISKISLLFRSL